MLDGKSDDDDEINKNYDNISHDDIPRDGE